MVCAVPFFPGRDVLDPEIRGQVNKPDAGGKQIRCLGHRGGIWRCKKHEITVPVGIQGGFTEFQIDQATEIRKQFGNRSTGLAAGGYDFHAGLRMPRQQAHQFDTGIPGTTNYSNLYHSIVQVMPLKWTQYYKKTVFGHHKNTSLQSFSTPF